MEKEGDSHNSREIYVRKRDYTSTYQKISLEVRNEDI